MATKKARQPMIQQQWAAVPSGLKHITRVEIGPHVLDIVAYPNDGYYLEINGQGMTIAKFAEIVRGN